MPADSWLELQPRPYVADYFRLLIGIELGPTATVDLSTVDWPFVTPPSDLGQAEVPTGTNATVAATSGTVEGPARCAPLGRDDVGLVRAALDRAAVEVGQLPNGGFVAYVSTGTPDRRLVLIAEPLLPDSNSCAHAFW